jgi:hypothetical protein
MLASNHDVTEFDCGKHASLTDWLKRLARMNQASGEALTYVVHRESIVVGYYSLAPGSVSRKQATAPEPASQLLNRSRSFRLLAWQWTNESKERASDLLS